MKRYEKAFPYLLLLTPALAVFALIPYELYYNQRALWNFSMELPLGVALTGCAAYAITAFIIYLVSRFNPTIALGVCVFLFLCGIFVLAADVFSPLQVTLLDGHAAESSEPLKNTVIETAIFLAVFTQLFFYTLRQLALAGSVISLILALTTGIYTAVLLTPPPHKERIPRPQGIKTPPGNIYHIVLDEMQTDIALYYFKRHNTEHLLSGFRVFPLNTSNYLYTSSSMPSYMTGTLYREKGSFKKWQNSFKKSGLLKAVFESGYKITMLSPRSEWDSPLVSEFLSYPYIFKKATGHINLLYKDFIQLWTARLFPNFLSNEALLLGKKAALKTYDLIKEGRSYPDTIQGGFEPYTAHLALSELISSEPARASSGEYVYAHAILPHGPYILRSNCTYDPLLGRKKTDGYYHQVRCAFKMVEAFLRELKQLSRYDSSTIIIQADTGHGIFGYIKEVRGKLVGTADKRHKSAAELAVLDEFDWKPAQLFSRALALLMIKPPHSTVPLSYSRRKSQLIDLLPTIVQTAYLKYDISRLPGSSLFADSFPENRPHYLFIYPKKDSQPLMTRVPLDNDSAVYKRMARWLPAAPSRERKRAREK